MKEIELRSYHQYGKRYVILCTGHHHWRVRRELNGFENHQEYAGRCPEGCPNHGPVRQTPITVVEAETE